MSSANLPRIALEHDPPVLIARLNHGVTNAIDPPMVRSLEGLVRHARTHADVRALILTSANTKFFSIGLDLPFLLNLQRTDLAEFIDAVSWACLELFRLPIPTIASIPGHATAGGCILALCCDHRYIGEGRSLIGLNEVRLGVPIPHVADAILQGFFGPRVARDVTDEGEFLPPARALALGLVDDVLPAADLLPLCLDKARRLAEMPGDALARIKSSRLAPIVKAIEADLEARNREFVDAWFTQEAQAKLHEAATKF